MASVSLQYRPEDFLGAWRLQLRHNRLVRISRFVPLFLIAISLLGSWTEIRDRGLIYGLIMNLPMIGLSALLFGFNVLSDRVLLPRRAKRFVAQQKSMQGDAVISWDAEGVTFAVASGQSRVAWGDYFKWLENDTTLLLFQSENLFNALPKRCLDDAQITEIRGYMTAALGAAGKKRKAPGA